MWEKIKGWMRSHWKTVAAISLALVAAIVVGAVCANPVGAPIVAALASVKIFSFLATTSPVWIPFVMGGLAAAATLTAAIVFNAATWVANWLDKKIDKKGAGKDETHYPDIDDKRSSRAFGPLGGPQNNRKLGSSSQASYEQLLSSTPANKHTHSSQIASTPPASSLSVGL